MTKDLQESSKEKANLIVKNNFYISIGHSDDLLFVPTGSSVGFKSYSTSSIPYYELQTYKIHISVDNQPIIINGHKVINSRQDITLKNCVREMSKKDRFNSSKDQKHLVWSDIFVQRFEDVIKV